jgi:predicted MPP superfamily phosphohydrolase
MESQELSIERHTIFIPRLGPSLDGFTVALLSDLHYGVYMDSLLRSAVVVLNRARPDVVLLAGDFVTWHHDNVDHLSRDAHTCSEILSRLRAPHGVLSVLGNHDYSVHPEVVVESLKYYGIRLLRNSAVPLEKNNERLWVAGIDDVLQGKPNLSQTLRGIPRGEPTILLAHEPDYADQVSAEHRVDLQLSGHSHGGQVRFPFLGAPVLPVLAWKYPMGFYRLRDMQLYTNRGIGMTGPLVRFNCPPEVTLFTLSSSTTPSPALGSSNDIRLLELD